MIYSDGGYDPQWQKMSASLRKGVLYVKMPIEKAQVLLATWKLEGCKDVGEGAFVASKLFDLIRDEAKASEDFRIRSVFYSSPIDKCREDIDLIGKHIDLARKQGNTEAAEILNQFREVLELGLKLDPGVDWIARTGGPPARASDALQPEPQRIEEIIDLVLD